MNLYKRLRKLRTLLVDDDEWIRNSMCLFFESEGCYLLAVETAEEAMAEVSRQTYDIVISDYRLPGMDGLEFFKKIQDHPQIIKILITAYGSTEVLSMAKTVGVNDLIEKPFTMEIIEETLLRFINKIRFKGARSQVQSRNPLT